VRNLEPDFSALRACDAHGVIVTAPSTTKGFDFVSRFFAPSVGIDEDPVTGFAHCCLAPYWAERLGRKEMRAFQASKRGGVLGLRVENDRVRLSGRALTALRGELLV
jgi:predicted PhzF superfamily epimerase YddE/YHI9